MSIRQGDKIIAGASQAPSDVYTKSQINELLENKQDVAQTGDYYITDKVLADAMATKAQKADTLSGYGITDAYTKTETESKISQSVSTKADASNVYTKSEIDEKLSGEGIDLSSYLSKSEAETTYATKTENEAKVDKIDGYSLISSEKLAQIDTNKSDIATKISSSEKGVASGVAPLNSNTKISDTYLNNPLANPSGHSGQYLKSNGSSNEWVSVREIPEVTEETSGKVLKSDGLTYYWGDTSEGDAFDYEQAVNKPQINSIELVGNKTLSDLGIQAAGDYAYSSTVNSLSTDLNNLTSTVNGLSSSKQDKLTAGDGITIIDNTIYATNSGTGGGGESVPDNVYTEENLVAGENVTFDKESGTDDNTIALFHFDGDTKDVVSGNELSETPIIATEGKFGTGSLKARENWFNSVSFAKSIDPKTASFTLEFWHKQVAGSVMGYYGDETTIVLAPTAPNDTASKSQWVGLYMLPDGSNNKISLQIGDNRLGQFYTTNYTTLGEWNHYALTWDASTHYFKLYMNGTYVDQYQYYYYNSLPILGGIGMFKYTDGNDGDTKAQMYIDELRFSDTVRYTGNFEVATEAFPSDKLKTVVNVNISKSGFNKDNLLGGKDIEIIPEPVDGGIDEHTVACWHFDGNQQDEVSGLNFYTSDGTYLTGKFGQAITKNSGNYVASAQGLLSDKITASGNYTVDFWLYYTQSTTIEGGVNIGGNGYYGVKLAINQTTGKVSIKIQNTEKASATYTFAVNTWYHLVLQKKGNIISVFVNGVKIFEYDASADIGSFTASGVQLYQFFVAMVDEVRISDVARYDGDFTPPVQAYRLEVPTGKYLINYTGQSSKNIGEVYYSQSSLATDNAGALPLFTGETIASADTIYPEFYSWVESHTELQTSIQEYNKSIQDFGECPKYVLNGSETRYYWTNASYTNLGWQCYTLSATPAVGDVVWLDSKTGTFEPVRNVASVVSTDPYTWAISNETLNGEPVTFTGTTETDGVVVSLDDGSLRLPKKSLSHGTVVKEKKPTDIDPAWYRQWSDGWLEQGGYSTGATTKTITFLKPFATETPTVICTGRTGNIVVHTTELSSTTFKWHDSATPESVGVFWRAEGQGADGAQDETLYPWVYAYSAVIPASTAQAAEFQEGLSGKADTNLGNIPANYDYVVESYSDDEGNWYRIYKSGWIEQGCSSTNNTLTTNTTITYLKPFANNSYMLAGPIFVISNAGAQTFTEKTATGFTTGSNLNTTGTSWWYACGQGAEL